MLWLILLVASLTVLSSFVTPFLKTLQTQTIISLDWGGYVVASDTIGQRPLVVAVNGSWIVPTVAVSLDDTFSAAWIGIGGQSENTLIQVGSEHDSIRGQPRYSLWYEMLPAESIPIPDIVVSPGDEITASISLLSSSSNDWLIVISDLTSGQSFRETFAYNSSRLTAEWIVERPTVNNQVSTLANFGSITFTNATAQIDQTVGTISRFSNYEVILSDRQNTQLVTLSSLSAGGSSFTATYG